MWRNHRSRATTASDMRGCVSCRIELYFLSLLNKRAQIRQRTTRREEHAAENVSPHVCSVLTAGSHALDTQQTRREADERLGARSAAPWASRWYG